MFLEKRPEEIRKTSGLFFERASEEILFSLVTGISENSTKTLVSIRICTDSGCLCTSRNVFVISNKVSLWHFLYLCQR